MNSWIYGMVEILSEGAKLWKFETIGWNHTRWITRAKKWGFQSIVLWIHSKIGIFSQIMQTNHSKLIAPTLYSGINVPPKEKKNV